MTRTPIATLAVLCLISATARSQRLPPANRPGPQTPMVQFVAPREQIPLPAAMASSQAQSPPTAKPASRPAAGLTLPDLEQMALLNNPTLSQARAGVRAARGVWQQVGLYPNPVAGYESEEVGDDGKSGLQGGFIGQQFVTAGKLRLNRRVAGQQIMRLEQELAAQQFRVLTDVQTRFYEVLVAQRTIEITDKLVKIAAQGVQAADALVKIKEGSRVDLLQARVERNTTRILLENARYRYQGAWRRLAAVTGLADGNPEQLLGDVEDIGPPLHWKDAFSRLLSESPELAAAAAEVEAARWATRRARVEWIPNINLRATVQHDNSTGGDLTGLQVAIPLPLFNRNQGNIMAADSRLIASQRNVERVRLSLQNRLAVVFRQYASAGQQVQRYRDTILPDAKETLDLVTSGYQQGEFNYLSLLTVQRTYFQSNLAVLDSLLQFKSAQVRIEGLLLGESLSGSATQSRKP